MEALYNKYRDDGLEILAVNCLESRDDVVAFMKSNKLTFPAALDADGKVSASYGIQGIPTTFLIGRDGKIVLRFVGSIDWNTPKIHAAMECLLREK
jgi:peroxiredoxin